MITNIFDFAFILMRVYS